jgi:4-hydroxy-L-threonine phosphate dehydrogenase PdxA
MSDKKKIVDARADKQGNITEVKLKGNTTFTPLETAIRMTKQGKIDAVVVKPTNAKEHLRTRPDNKESNNLDDMAGDN